MNDADQPTVIDIVHDIAHEYRPHHTTPAFWYGVSDAQWNSSLHHPGYGNAVKREAYCNGKLAFHRAMELVEDDERERWDYETRNDRS